MAISHLEQRDAGVWQAIAAEDRPVLVLLYAALTVEMVFFIVLGPLLPTYADDLDLSTSAAGLLAAAYSLGCGLAAIPAGLLVARIGARPVAVGDSRSSVRPAPASPGRTRSSRSTSRGSCRASARQDSGQVRSRGCSSCPTARDAEGSSASRSPPRAWERRSGPPWARWPASRARAPVFLALSASILALAVFGVALARARPGAGDEAPAPPRVRATLTRPVAGALGLVALPSVAFGIAGVLVPLRLHDLGAAVAAISAAYLVAAVVEAATQPVIGRWYDARGAVQVLRVTLAASAAALVVLATGLPEWPLLVALAIAWPIFSTVWVPALAELTRRVEGTGGQHGVALGLFMACWACFQALGAIGGSALEAVGGAVPFLALAAAYAVVAVRT